MDSATLVNPPIKAGEWFAGEFDKYKPVKAAFWRRSEGDENWYLCIASDEIDDTNFGSAYREVLRISQTHPNPWIDPFRVKIVRKDDRVACAITALGRRYPGQTPIVVHASMVDGVWIDDAIVYTPPFAARDAVLPTA